MRDHSKLRAFELADNLAVAVYEATRSFLGDQGMKPGARFVVRAVAAESLLVRVASAEISLSRSLADAIDVEPESTEQ